jgi:signal transduction histidine kinase
MGSTFDYEPVFNAMLAPLVVLRPDLVIVAANNSYLKATGRTRADLLGRPIFTAFPANPKAHNDPDARGVAALRASLERVVATGKPESLPLQRHEAEVAGEPGMFEERYWSSINTPVLGPNGEVKLVIHRSEEVTGFLHELRLSHGRDVTGARAELEEMETDVYAHARDLLDLSDRLKQAYGKQSQTLSALAEAVERQRRFVFDASHDLRNPITGLLTDLEVALSEAGADPRSDPRKILRKLLRDAERLNDIVADMLELARLDAVTPPATEPVDLSHAIVDELERHDLPVTVLTRLDHRVVVPASRIRLARLLNNLVTNAERHTTSKIEIIVKTDPPDAVLEVIDDGPGIRPAEREKVFERHYRLYDARCQDSGGSGLGLPIAREIARAYGGDLYAADHDCGARFVLRLPLAT